MQRRAEWGFSPISGWLIWPGYKACHETGIPLSQSTSHNWRGEVEKWPEAPFFHHHRWWFSSPSSSAWTEVQDALLTEGIHFFLSVRSTRPSCEIILGLSYHPDGCLRKRASKSIRRRVKLHKPFTYFISLIPLAIASHVSPMTSGSPWFETDWVTGESASVAVCLRPNKLWYFWPSIPFKHTGTHRQTIFNLQSSTSSPMVYLWHETGCKKALEQDACLSLQRHGFKSSRLPVGPNSPCSSHSFIHSIPCRCHVLIA